MDAANDSPARPQLVRVVERDRPVVAFVLDGVPASAREGDTILTAVLALRDHLVQPPGEPPRAGFCLMGACQECWVDVDAKRARACGTLVQAGMRVNTRRPGFGA